MKRINWFVELGGAYYDDDFEIDEDATEEEISDEVYEKVLNTIYWGWDEDNEDDSETI